MTITEKELAEKLESISASMLGLDKKEAWTRVAREAAELMGVDLAPEPKPLPVEPGSVILATEVRGGRGKWRAFLGPDGYWTTSERINGYIYHSPEYITAWAPARVVPAGAAPVTLTEDQVGEVWDANKSLPQRRWTAMVAPARGSITATVNAALAQHAAPAEEAT